MLYLTVAMVNMSLHQSIHMGDIARYARLLS
jgi:hypothetical protein